MVAFQLPPIIPGSPVAVRWANGRFYLARSIGPAPGGHRIHFADGAMNLMPYDSVVPVPLRPTFLRGDRVMAVWKTDQMFPGTITDLRPEGYVVAWHDGDVPLIVRPGCLTWLVWAESIMPTLEQRPIFDPDSGLEILPDAAPTGGGQWIDVTDQVLRPAAGKRPTPPPLPPSARPNNG